MRSCTASPINGSDHDGVGPGTVTSSRELTNARPIVRDVDSATEVGPDCRSDWRRR